MSHSQHLIRGPVAFPIQYPGHEDKDICRRFLSNYYKRKLHWIFPPSIPGRTLWQSRMNDSAIIGGKGLAAFRDQIITHALALGQGFLP